MNDWIWARRLFFGFAITTVILCTAGWAFGSLVLSPFIIRAVVVWWHGWPGLYESRALVATSALWIFGPPSLLLVTIIWWKRGRGEPAR